MRRLRGQLLRLLVPPDLAGLLLRKEISPDGRLLTKKCPEKAQLRTLLTSKCNEHSFLEKLSAKEYLLLMKEFQRLRKK